MNIYTITDPKVSSMLKQGGIGIIPTDTVYGIISLLDNKEAVERVLTLKNRTQKPIGTIIAGTIEQLNPFLNKKLIDVAKKYWPGSVSIVLPVGDELTYAHKHLNSLPFRIPDDAKLRQLAISTGLIATTSANLPGEQPVETMEEAIGLFGTKVDFYVDGGTLRHKRPSKIIKINEDKTVEVIREG